MVPPKIPYVEFSPVLVRTLERGLQSTAASRRTAAQAIAALCVRGMVTARGVDDNAFADELRKASIAAALRLGGWEKAANSKPRLLRTASRGCDRKNCFLGKLAVES